jgi:hypothetical protein
MIPSVEENESTCDGQHAKNKKKCYNNVTYRPIARQLLGKHIPAGANARSSEPIV